MDTLATTRALPDVPTVTVLTSSQVPSWQVCCIYY